MLCPNLTRQRMIVEFTTDTNLEYAGVIEQRLFGFLMDLCISLDMTPLKGPYIATVEDGTSAYMMWMESGVQCHTWFKEKFVSVDIYSCRPYTPSVVLDTIDRWFNVKEIEVS